MMMLLLLQLALLKHGVRERWLQNAQQAAQAANAFYADRPRK